MQHKNKHSTINTLANKREQFRNNIRKQYLQQIFQKNRQAMRQDNKKLLTQLKFDNFLQLINDFNQSLNQQDAYLMIQKIHRQLLNQNNNVYELMRRHGNDLVKIFSFYPQHDKATQIYYFVIRDVYDYIFKEDDYKFAVLYDDQRCLQVKIDRKQMTILQFSVEVLLETLQKEIELMIDEQKQSKQISRLVLLFECLGQLCLNQYKFTKRLCYVEKYAQKWMRDLLLKVNVKNQGFLIWLNTVQKLPFQSFNKNQSNQVNSNIQKQQEQILQKLQQLSFPSSKKIKLKQDSIPILSFMLIKNIFEHKSIKIQKIIKHFTNLLYLIKATLSYRQYYEDKNVLEQYNLVRSLVQRINSEIELDKQNKVLRQINIVTELYRLEFFKIFQLYFQHQSSSFKVTIYAILKELINYCINMDINLEYSLFINNNFLTYIVDGIQSDLHEVILQSLYCILSICEYSQKNHILYFFVRFVWMKIERNLDNLVYHRNQMIKQLALVLLNEYFTEQKLLKYTINEQIEEENGQKHENIILESENRLSLQNQ